MLVEVYIYNMSLNDLLQELTNARNILERIYFRDLYRCVDHSVYPSVAFTKEDMNKLTSELVATHAPEGVELNSNDIIIDW